VDFAIKGFAHRSFTSDEKPLFSSCQLSSPRTFLEATCLQNLLKYNTFCDREEQQKIAILKNPTDSVQSF